MSWSYKLRKSIRESLGVVANKTKLGLPLPASIGPMISNVQPRLCGDCRRISAECSSTAVHSL